MSDDRATGQADGPGIDGAVAPEFRAGIVAVIGRPNVGKSTLVNHMVGYKVSIVSRKAQTTRHRILGIDTSPAGQIVFVDTPGLHQGGRRAIHRYMNRTARGALVDVDLALLVIEAGRWQDGDEMAWRTLESSGLPGLLVINKVDRVRDKARLLPFIAEATAGRSFLEVFPVSARNGLGLTELREGILRHLPVSAALHDADAITDRSERFLVGELVREQLMRQLGAELPYASTVVVDQFVEDGQLLRIAATIFVERESQKGIVVGAGGQRMRSIGQAARLAMERQFGRKVHLELWCKHRAAWSDDETALRQFGYE